MVIECLAQPGYGALSWSLQWLSKDLVKRVPKGGNAGAVMSRPWVVLNTQQSVETKSGGHLYLPALSKDLRKATAQKQILWVYAPVSVAPFLIQKFLETSLCEGLLALNVDSFAKNSPAAVWGRRWQLASERGHSTLIWVHSKKVPMVGVDMKLVWNRPGAFVLSKGRHLLEKKERQSDETTRERNTHSTAA